MSKKKQIASLRARGSKGDRFSALFEDLPVSLWEEDFSQVKKQIGDLRDSGISDFEAYFQDHPEAVRRCAGLVKVIAVNRASLELFQAHNRKTFLEGLNAFYIEETYEAFQEELIAISKGRTIFETQTTARTMAGESRNLLMRWSVAPGHEDTFARVIVSMIDTTEGKQAEAALRASEASKRTLLEAIPDMIFLLGKDGTYLDYKPGKEIRPYIPASKFLGKKISEVLPLEVAQPIMDMVQRALETGRAQVIEYELSEEDGQHAYEGRLSASGKETVLGVVRDITDRKRVKERLRDTKESLQTLVHTAPAAIVSVDNQGNVLSWNPAAEEMFGWSSQEVIGRPLPVLPPDKRGEYETLREKNLRGQVVRNLETHRRRKDGALLDVSLSLAPLRGASGSIYGSMGIINDITERKRATDTINALLKSTSSMIGEEFFRSLTRNLAISLNVRYAFISELIDEETLRTIALWKDKGFEPNFEYSKKDTPCEELLERGIVCYSKNVQQFFPKDTWLREAGIESYLGVLFSDPSGHPMGHMGVMDSKPMQASQWFETTLILFATRAGAELGRRHAEEKLQRLSGQLLRLQDEERRRVAEELHQNTAQSMAAALMNLSLVRRSAATLDAKARQALSECSTLMDRCLREVRTLSYLLHPPLLDEVGLASALRWYVDGFAKRSGIRIDLDVSSDLDRMPLEIETTLFRTVQECLTNIHLHSGSPTAKVRLIQDPTAITIFVIDEGCGMSSGEMTKTSRSDAEMGVGISGMRQRLKQFGGRLEMFPNHPGTTVKAVLPLLGTDS